MFLTIASTITRPYLMTKEDNTAGLEMGLQRRWRRTRIHRSGLRTFAVCLFVVVIYSLYSGPRQEPEIHLEEVQEVQIPPMPLDKGMNAIAEWEQALPGNVVIPHSGGERYLRFLNENWGVGFNNQLQEILVHAHLAYLSNRTYVFPPLNFPNSDEWYPLSAFVRGALAGSPSPSRLSHHPHAPRLPPQPTLRAVTRNHFHQTCPAWEQAPSADYSTLHRAGTQPSDATPRVPESRSEPTYRSVSSKLLADALGFEYDPPGDTIMDGWVRVLSGEHELGEASCVMVDRVSDHVFDYRLFGSPRILPLLPSLLRSPVLLDLHWSDLVHGAAQRNLRAWGWIPDPPASSGPERDLEVDAAREQDTHAPLPRTLALHIRRGDYKEHCEFLNDVGSNFLGVNEAEGVQDQFIWPGGRAKTPEERTEFTKRCWPELGDILARVREVRKAWQAQVELERWRGWRGLVRALLGRRRNEGEGWWLRQVYVLTNGDGTWWEEVKRALEEEGWEVQGTRGMDFARGEGVREKAERVVGLAVDMEIAERAEVFVGNGFSSLTSNVNLLRMAHDRPRESIRFW